MLLFWRIRYLDTRDRQFKDRDLYLDTDTLDPATKAAVEYACELRGSGSIGREILRYRSLFLEGSPLEGEAGAKAKTAAKFHSFCIPDYFEDEVGEELSTLRMGQVLSGDPNAVMFPGYYRAHDMQLALAQNPTIDIGPVRLSQQGLDSVAYFARDLTELVGTEFHKNGPGTLTKCRDAVVLKTATTHDEIRSFVSVFRRLYMRGEPGCFVNAATIFSKAVDHPIARWVGAERDLYVAKLDHVPDDVPFPGLSKPSFTRKTLIDAFLNTKFAHQPQKRRIRQYELLLDHMGSEDYLSWLFYTTVYLLSAHYVSAGRPIQSFLRAYTQAHNASPSFDRSCVTDGSGVGALEKAADRKARIFREKAEELAFRLWQGAGRPEGGPTQFLQEARDELRRRLEG